jgi:pyruvate dehydrogenase E1 component alpha subunit
MWIERDPLERVRLLLEKAGGWDQEWQSAMEQSASEAIEAAVEWAESVSSPTQEEMLNRMSAPGDVHG